MKKQLFIRENLLLIRINKYFTEDEFEFTGFDKIPSTCKVDIWRNEEYTSYKLIRYIVLISELPINTGTSAFNMSDYLATIIFKWLELTSPVQFIWFEAIPKRGKGRFKRKAEFVIVKYKFKKGIFSSPIKIPYNETDFFNLIGGT